MGDLKPRKYLDRRKKKTLLHEIIAQIQALLHASSS